MRRRAALLLATLALAGCVTGPTDGGLATQDDRAATLAAMRSAHARWVALGLRDYSFEFQRSCFCPEDVRARVVIHVRGGRIDRVVRLDTGAGVPSGSWAHYFTIDELFTQLFAVATRAWEMRVTYDTAQGYPRDVFVDEVRLAVDEEQWYELRGLLPQGGSSGAPAY